jgi:Protein of unknown function (DUF642)/PEP-CTERM motif
MSTIRMLLAGVSLAGAVLAAGGSQANLLTNGSFETGAFVDNTGQDTDSLPVGSTAITGWTVIGQPGAWIGPTNPFSLTASSGSYFLDLTGYQSGAPFSGVSQSIATVAGAQYSLTFDLGSSSIYGLEDGVTASAGGASGVFTSTNGGSSTNLWQTETLNFTATGTSTLISLIGNSGDNYIGLDNVDVLETRGVPEPATWTMMILGFAGLGGAMRARRRPLTA